MNFRDNIIVFTIIGLILMWAVFFAYLIKYGEYVRDNPIVAGTVKLNLTCVCTSEKLPEAEMKVDNQGNVTYYYPKLKHNQTMNFTQLEELFKNVKRGDNRSLEEVS